MKYLRVHLGEFGSSTKLDKILACILADQTKELVRSSRTFYLMFAPLARGLFPPYTTLAGDQHTCYPLGCREGRQTMLKVIIDSNQRPKQGVKSRVIGLGERALAFPLLPVAVEEEALTKSP